MRPRGAAGALAVALALGLALPDAVPAQEKSRAFVQDDGTLKIEGRTVRLFGIYIPDDGRVCATRVRPVRCRSRAAAALDFKIRGFVACEERGRAADGGVSAVCYAGRSFHEPGLDLGAYLIREGLAVARPEAPFEYKALERIARERGLGVWGLPAGAIR